MLWQCPGSSALLWKTLLFLFVPWNLKLESCFPASWWPEHCGNHLKDVLPYGPHGPIILSPTSDVLVILLLHKRFHICLPFKNMNRHVSTHKSKWEVGSNFQEENTEILSELAKTYSLTCRSKVIMILASNAYYLLLRLPNGSSFIKNVKLWLRHN